MGKNVITYTVATFVASLLVYFIYPLLPTEEIVLDWLFFVFTLLFVYPVLVFFRIVFEGLSGFVDGFDQMNEVRAAEILSNYSGLFVLFIFCFGLIQPACDCLYSSFIKKEPTTTTTQNTTTPIEKDSSDSS